MWHQIVVKGVVKDIERCAFRSVAVEKTVFFNETEANCS